MDIPISIRDFMAKKLITFTPETNALAAIRTLLKHKISGAPVINDEGDIVGMFSEKDCMRTILESSYHDEMGALVSELMSTEVTTVEASDSIMDVAAKFMSTSFRRFPVIDKEKLVGQISRRDVLRAIEKISKK